MNKVMAMIASFLKIEKFSQKDGKASLTEEQRAKVESTFGKEFTAKFVDYLAKGDQETEASEENSELLAELISGMVAASEANTSKLTEAFNTKLNELKTAKESEIAALTDKVNALADSQEEDVVPEMDSEIPRAEGVASALKVDMRKPLYAAVGHFLKTGAGDFKAESIDVGDLRNEFGTYLSQGRNNLDMIDTLFQGFTSAKYFTSKRAITERRAIQALITSVSQQFVPKWTPGGKTKFRPLTIKNRRHKINYSVTPAEVLDSYMMGLYDERLAPDQMPITKWIINRMMYPQVLQDQETRMVFKGKFEELDWGDVNENDPGQAPEKSMDGVETILADNKSANAANIRYFPDAVLDFMALDKDQMLEYTRDYVRWLAPIFKRTSMPIGCSDEFFRHYQWAYKEKWGPGSNKSDETDFGSNRIDFSRQYLVPMDGMYNSPILFATPKANLIKLRNFNEAPRVINDVQKWNYEVRFIGEYWLGVGFDYGEAVFACVPDGYTPYNEIDKMYDAHDTYQQNKGVETGSGSGSGSGGL